MKYPELQHPAPSFSLQNQNDETKTLSDYTGKWLVLYFYPKAMTPGCTTQACELRDHKSELEALNAIAVGVSPDAVKRLTKFTDRDSLNFDLLSDEDHSIADAYGVWGPKKFMGREYDGIHRTTFIINPEGELHKVLNKFKTKSHHDDVIAELKAAQS